MDTVSLAQVIVQCIASGTNAHSTAAQPFAGVQWAPSKWRTLFGLHFHHGLPRLLLLRWGSPQTPVGTLPALFRAYEIEWIEGPEHLFMFAYFSLI